jgi:hypothetical protein
VTTDTTTLPDKVERTARLRWVPLSKIKVNPAAQREMKQYRVDHILANLDLDQLGNPVLNERDGSYWVIDGQHRIEALRQFGFTDETIQCWVHVGLSEQEEAKRFLLLNDTLTVDALAKYRAAIVSKDDVPGAIGAVNTLRRVYGRSGPVGLGRTLRIIHKSFGDSGLEAAVIDGIGLLCQRYNGELEESVAIERLSRLSAGANGLLGDAEKLRRSTGAYKSHCVAAAAVDVINRGKGGRKLPSWWKDS